MLATTFEKPLKGGGEHTILAFHFYLSEEWCAFDKLNNASDYDGKLHVMGNGDIFIVIPKESNNKIFTNK